MLVIKGQSIDTFFFKLREELNVFFTDHFHLSDCLHDDEFLTRLVYLGDVFSRLNDLNLGLLRLSTTIFNVRNKIEAMIKKLELFSVCINKDNTEVFSSLYDFFLCANELKLTDNVKCDIAKNLSELHAQLRRYFPETDDTNNWICFPFHALPPVHLPISEQESLIEIATSGSVKIELNQKSLPDFWIGLRSEYLALANLAFKTQLPFPTKYLCESGFSALTSMKTKYRHRLCVENDLRVRLSPIQPNIAEL